MEKNKSEIEEAAKGKKLYQDRCYSEAIAQLEKVVASKPNRYAYFYIAASFIKLKKFVQARDAFLKSFEIVSTGPEQEEYVILLDHLGDTELKLDLYEESLKHFDRALDVASRVYSKDDFWTFKRGIEMKKRELKEAQAAQERKGFEEISKQAKEMHKLKSFKEAIELYTKVLTKEKKPNGYYMRADCYKELKLFKEAIEDYNNCIELSKYNSGSSDYVPHCLIGVGDCHFELGNYDKAMEFYKKAKDKASNFFKSDIANSAGAKYLLAKGKAELCESVKRTSPVEKAKSEPELNKEREFVETVLNDLSKYEELERTWYLVSKKWSDSWSSYVKKDESEPMEISEKADGVANDPNSPTRSVAQVKDEKKEAPKADPREKKRIYPGPIYNDDIVKIETTLLDPDEKKNYFRYGLKPGLKETIDFKIVPRELWEYWKKEYGGLDLPRFAYKPEKSERILIDVFLQRIELEFIPRYEFIPEPDYVKILYMGKREPLIDLRSKLSRIVSKWLEPRSKYKIDDLTIRLWKLNDPDTSAIDKAIERRMNPIGIDGLLIEEAKCIEELALGDTNKIIVEIYHKTDQPKFVVKKVLKPRFAEVEEMGKGTDWKKYVTLEGQAFMKIPLRCIIETTGRCGKTGLENLGNTCYMNSGLQCLSNCQELTKYFLLGLHRAEINKSNPLGQKGGLAMAYASLLHDLWNGNYRAASAYDLKQRLVINADQFRGYAQQDSQELIQFLLDGLHEDLNRVTTKPYIESKDYDGRPDEILCKEQWNNYLKRNRSIIVDLFCGQLKSKLICPCTNISVTFDPFMVLSVPIPQIISLEVKFVYFNLEKKAALLQIVVNDKTSVGEIHNKLLAALKLPPSTKIFYATIYKGEVYKQLAMTTTYSEMPQKGNFYAYEIVYDADSKGAEEKDCYYLEVQMQTISRGMYSGSYRNDLDYPLIFPVPPLAKITELKLEIFRRLQLFFPKVESADKEKLLSSLYTKYFPIDNEKIHPYFIEIANNRLKQTSYYSYYDKYEECEFCTDGAHSGNCEFTLKEEGKVTFKDVLASLKVKRNIILNVVFMDKNDLIKVDHIKKHFEECEDVAMDSFKSGEGGKKVSLYDCLEWFSMEEQLDKKNMWHCPKCKQDVEAKKKMDVFRLPTVLIIHLKRFKNKSDSAWASPKKIEDYISYPRNGLNMSRFVKAPADISGGVLYDLFAVSNHFGGLSGGHYTATCFSVIAKKWFYFNDSSVYEAGDEDVASSAGYVLFYRRVSEELGTETETKKL